MLSISTSLNTGEAEVNKIFSAIQRELDRSRDRFGRPSEIDFSLGDEEEDDAEDEDE